MSGQVRSCSVCVTDIDNDNDNDNDLQFSFNSYMFSIFLHANVKRGYIFNWLTETITGCEIIISAN